MLVVILLIVFGVIFLGNRKLGFIMNRSIINDDTKRILRVVSEYHSAYFIISGIILVLLLQFLWSKLPMVNLDQINIVFDIIFAFISRLENSEYTYQCQFGFSFKAIRCEIYGNINRFLILGTYQILKYTQVNNCF